jgi:protease I
MADFSSKHVALLVDNYFEEVEFTKPKEALEEAGAQVTVISTGEESLQGMNHAELGNTFMPDLTIEDAQFDDYDMLVLPGGAINADNLRMDQKAREWAQYCIENEVPLAAICHAPWLLASSDVVDGMKLTSFWTIQDDMRNAGADWVDKELVIDNNVITSRKPDDLPAFCEALIEMLESTPVHAAM